MRVATVEVTECDKCPRHVCYDGPWCAAMERDIRGSDSFPIPDWCPLPEFEVREYQLPPATDASPSFPWPHHFQLLRLATLLAEDPVGPDVAACARRLCEYRQWARELLREEPTPQAERITE